ncbi:hypothetical protein OTU49_014109, partial [Cherax quadricarinatus]
NGQWPSLWPMLEPWPLSVYYGIFKGHIGPYGPFLAASHTDRTCTGLLRRSTDHFQSCALVRSGSTRICLALRGSIWLYEELLGSTRINLSLRLSTWLYEDLSGFTRIYLALRESTWLY